jgi:hypothetical protein
MEVDFRVRALKHKEETLLWPPTFGASSALATNS